ncbi:TNF receptor-associated factor 3-like isoform X1 [Amblyomma americanum]
MAPANKQYTLVGFSPELDWRPLTFLKPIPGNRVCSACGLVRKRTALLPCMHVLCECCYEQCDQDGLNECPLDGNHYEKEDVALFHCTADDLLKREVNCWNEGSGCEYATTASRISQHFLLECEHHSVCCPKCSATVLCRDVCKHLRSASCNTSTPVASESQVPVSQVDEAASSLRGTFEGQGGEIAAYPRPIAVDTSTNGDRLSEISHVINTLKETLRQELTSLKELNHEEITTSNAEVKQCLASCTDTVNTCLRRIKMVENKLNNKLGATGIDLSQIAASVEQVKTELKERDQKSLQLVTSARRVSALQVTQCEFFVRGAKSLQQEALKNGRAEYDSERVYLRGYCMSPGARFMSDSTSLLLFVKYTLHKGDMDDDVQWPFKHKIRVSLMHPSGRGERVPVFRPTPDDPGNQKPTTSSRQAVYSATYFYFKDLIRDLFVDNDQLRINFTLLPSVRLER